jgi:hypothetical protein
MHKFLNFILVVTLLVSGFIVYSLEHTTRGLEREIARSSSLTRPDRLRMLAAQHLGLSTLKAWQIVKIGDIVTKVPPEPVIKLEAQGSDPIGSIIDKYQQ